MATHDDQGLRLLERDLRTLAGPREGDKQLERALRDQLIAPHRPRRRPRISGRILVGSGALAAAAASAIVAFVGTGGSSGPAEADAAVIHGALSAVTAPANRILHVKVIGVQGNTPIAGESWQETSPPYASRYMKGAVGHQTEFSDNGTTSFQYDPATGTIHKQPDSSRLTFTNPISQIRQELASGQAQLVGTVVIRGASLYKIDLPNGLVGYFNERDYRPRYLDDPQQSGPPVRLMVAAYAYLPMTQSNRALLSVTSQHRNAPIEASPGNKAGK
jgi:hypothetical protein